MNAPKITHDQIFQCFAAAQSDTNPDKTAESFIDVEEYENAIMYPEFARWARKAGYPEIAKLFLKVAGEEKKHAVMLREIYSDMGAPKRGEDTQRAIDAMDEIRQNCDALLELNPNEVVEKALEVAIRVEEREYRDIYPRFRDDAKKAGLNDIAEVYQKVVDSEHEHATWFSQALEDFRSQKQAANQ